MLQRNGISWIPRWLSGKESICQCRRHEFNPWAWKIPWRKRWQPIIVLLPGKSQWQRSLVGYSPWGCKESDWAQTHALGLEEKQRLGPDSFTSKFCKPFKNLTLSLSNSYKNTEEEGNLPNTFYKLTLPWYQN